jgi:hypothetical protein
MVAAIVLRKKRLVDILEEACELDPLSGLLVDPPPSPPSAGSGSTIASSKRRRKGPREFSSNVDDSRSWKVIFSEEPVKVVYFNNYDSCMTEADREQVRRALWYTVRCESSKDDTRMSTAKV